jgi:ribosomal protein S18 acetylase RimI-like enzyme
MWRPAETSDDSAITALGLALYTEDPSPDPIPESSFPRTTAAFRAAPWRGRAIVLELDATVVGYAFLVSYWSNELGGEVCAIDELYIAPAARNHGWGTRLIEVLAAGSKLWPAGAVALALGVAPENLRARALYERLGFKGKNVSLSRRC